MTSREKFEAWMTDEQWFHGSDFEWDERRNCYAQFGIHLAYKAFLAAEVAAEQKLTDMAVQLANAESKCRELADDNGRLVVERDALRENIGGDITRSAADIYFQLVEECEIPPGGSLVGYIDDIKERLTNAENHSSELDNAICELLPGTQYMDPPDGGSVTPLEQVRRMVADYRNRIAELEARDEPKFVKCWSCKHEIEVLAIVDCDGYCPRCAAPIDLDEEPCAGIGVKGE